MSRLANFMLWAGKSISRRSIGLGNKFLNISKNIAANNNAKLKITLDEQSVSYKFENTDGDHNSVWENYYKGAGIFLKDHTPELKLDPDEIRNAKLDVIETARVEPMIKTKIYSKMWNFGEQTELQDKMITGTTIMVAVILILTLTL